MNEVSRTSTTLLEAARQGDEIAWREIQAVYSPLIYFWCRRKMLSASDTLEIVQNVLGKASIQLKEFQHNGRRGAFRKWLRMIAYREIADSFRGNPPRTVDQQWLENIAVEGEDDEQCTEEIAILYHRSLELVRDEFSSRDNDIFRRVVVEDGSPKQVAAELDVPSHNRSQSRVEDQAATAGEAWRGNAGLIASSGTPFHAT